MLCSLHSSGQVGDNTAVSARAEAWWCIDLWVRSHGRAGLSAHLHVAPGPEQDGMPCSAPQPWTCWISGRLFVQSFVPTASPNGAFAGSKNLFLSNQHVA